MKKKLLVIILFFSALQISAQPFEATLQQLPEKIAVDSVVLLRCRFELTESQFSSVAWSRGDGFEPIYSQTKTSSAIASGFKDIIVADETSVTLAQDESSGDYFSEATLTMKIEDYDLGVYRCLVTAVSADQNDQSIHLNVISSINVTGNRAFGNTEINTSKEAALTIQNTGFPWNAANIITPEGFTTEDSPLDSFGYLDSENFTITFSPTEAKTYSGNIIITTNYEKISYRVSSIDTIAVSGVGVQAVIAATGNLDFGGIEINTSEEVSLTINNTGGADLLVTDITLPEGFTTSESNFTIAPSDSKDITITFSPTEAKTYSGDITITSNAGSGTHTIAVNGVGLQAVIAVSGDLAFGDTEVNTSEEASLTINNTGDADLLVTDITLPEGFTTSESNFTIAPSDSEDITITFSPTEAKTYSGDITITSNAGSGTNTIAASGVGVQAVIAVTGNLDFGGIEINTSEEASLTISNTGNANLLVTAITLPEGFTTSESNFTIASSDSKDITITFSPTEAKTYSGDITITSNAGSGTHTIAVNGVGLQAVIAVTGNLDFGDTEVNTSEEASLTISNTGDADLLVTAITLPEGFTTSESNFTIAPSDSKDITITFSPTEAKSYSGDITITSNAGSGTNTIAASGVGLQAVIAVTGNLDFGGIEINTSEEASLTINNIGDADLLVTAITLPEGFTTSASNFTIAPSDSKDITITFSPTEAKSYSGDITITSNAGSGTNIVAVNGVGAQDGIGVSITSNDFGRVIVDSVAAETLTIHNTGDADLLITDITLPEGFTTSESNFTIAPSDSEDITITFSPTEAKTYSGDITITSNAGSGTNTIAASGVGLQAVIAVTGNLDFGGIEINTSEEASLTINNTGGADLLITAITLPEGFTTSESNFTIAPSDSKDIAITFSPTEAKTYSGDMTITSNAGSGTNTIAASGVGVQAVIAVSGDLAFGDTEVNTSEESSLTISNTGGADLLVTAITLPEGFTTSESSFTLAPSGSEDITITFSPTEAKSYSGDITITSNAGSGTNTIAASGVGVQAVIAVTGNLDFGDTEVNTSEEASLTINNTGNADLLVTDITLPEGFTASASSFTLAPSDSKDITITFSPTEAKTYSGDITITSNAGSGTHTIAASGTGMLLVGIEEIDEIKLFVYPNPNDGKFYLESSGQIKISLQIFRINTTHIVYSQEIFVNGRSQIDISNLPTGVYILKATDLKNRKIISTQKIEKI